MINVMDLNPGDKVRLSDDVIVEIIDNPRDGIWLQGRYITVPNNPSQEGEIEMIFAEDIEDMA